MLSINYYSYFWENSSSGGGVFDTNLANALGAEGTVRECTTPIVRKWALPVWQKRLRSMSQPRAGDLNIISHEGLHDLLETVRADCFIVHNYFTEFDFPRLRFINPLYRLGSEKIYSKIFSASKRIVFLSARERRLAAERYPEFAGKFLCQAPGHNESSEYFDGTRDANIVEIPGTLDWLPKKLSYSLNVGRGLPVDGEMVRGDSDHAFISVIYDSFLSGFKLKLVEMAKHGKSIVSFCDLREELANIGFDDLPYLFVRNRSELGAAITHFRQKGDLSAENRRACYLRGSAISWSSLAKAVLGA